jgi:hypothetical protein
MEPNRFLFKLVAILLQYVFVVIIFIPIVYFFHLLKYKFNAEDIYFIRILFFAIAFALPFVVANAFSFANYEKNDLTYYLKSHQKHAVLIQRNSHELLATTINHLTKLPFWKLVNQDTDSATFIKKNLILKDELLIKTKPLSDQQTELIITSKPKIGFIFLDFARNYQNIVEVLLATKHS